MGGRLLAILENLDVPSYPEPSAPQSRPTRVLTQPVAPKSHRILHLQGLHGVRHGPAAEDERRRDVQAILRRPCPDAAELTVHERPTLPDDRSTPFIVYTWTLLEAATAPAGPGTSKQAVCGILSRGGQVGAEVIPNVEAKTLQPLLRHRMHPGSVVCSDTFAGYTGIAAGGYIHRRAGRPAHLQGRGRAR